MAKQIIAKTAEHLRSWWKTTGKKEQSAFEKSLPDKERYRSSRNHRPHGGWSVVGNGAITQAIKAAGLPTDCFWSGSAPTPSTQAPTKIVEEGWRFRKSFDEEA